MFADAITDLMHQHQGELLRFLTPRVDCPDDAEDIVQETFIRYAEYQCHAPVDNARAFMFKVAANLAIDYQRRLARRNEVDIAELDLYQTLTDTAPLPDEAAFSEQQVERLIAALSELPTKCRDVFILLRVKNLTYGEVETQMGLSQTMILKYLTRALTHCREKLAED